MDRKVRFIFAAGNWEGWGQAPVQSSTPLTPDHQWAGAFRDGEGATHRNSTVSSDSALEIVMGGLTIVIWIVSSTVDLQFQVWFVSTSSTPVLRITAL